MSPRIEAEVARVVETVLRSAAVPEPERSELREELEGHLEESFRGALGRGRSEDQAISEALGRFGDRGRLTRAFRRRVLAKDAKSAFSAMRRDELGWWLLECFSVSVLVHGNGGLIGQGLVTWVGSLCFGAYLLAGCATLFFWVRFLIARVGHRLVEGALWRRALGWGHLFCANAVVFCAILVTLPPAMSACGLDGAELGSLSVLATDLWELFARIAATVAVYMVGLPTLIAMTVEVAASRVQARE